VVAQILDLEADEAENDTSVVGSIANALSCRRWAAEIAEGVAAPAAAASSSSSGKSKAVMP